MSKEIEVSKFESFSCEDDVFHFEAPDSRLDCVIDLTNILLFSVDRKGSSVELNLKLRNNTKATFIFQDEFILDSFVVKYGEYLKKRKTNEYVNSLIVKEVAIALKSELEQDLENIKNSIKLDVSAVHKLFSEQLQTFAVELKKESEIIAENVVSQQVKINEGNLDVLERMTSMLSASGVALSKFEEFSLKIDSFVNSVNSISPLSSEEIDEKSLSYDRFIKEANS